MRILCDKFSRFAKTDVDLYEEAWRVLRRFGGLDLTVVTAMGSPLAANISSLAEHVCV
jgi:hypothetical protein